MALLNETLHNRWRGNRKTSNTQIKRTRSLFLVQLMKVQQVWAVTMWLWGSAKSVTELFFRILQQMVKIRIQFPWDICKFFWTCIYLPPAWRVRQCWVCPRRSKQHILTGWRRTTTRVSDHVTLSCFCLDIFSDTSSCQTSGVIGGPRTNLFTFLRPVTRRCFAEQADEGL